ncbi:PGN_0703 family putative restriction endonuclease [Nocardioides zhouii]|uniref:Uncharacterized protein n=1 Tax=Nocardioides zhouii TaxID=1168729 RepID=A0A4Q2SKI3_9ACTN|nr:hypothetical protein [Nocardioides zhouii]RYC05653.1 hypothetical protein EUA94_18060 [Nocardioides zhouii]
MNKNPYASEQSKRQIHWLATSETLPFEARAGGTYTDRAGKEHGPLPLFLPLDLVAHNLLPDVRHGALALFAELGIPWHDGVDGGPSNHLRDSQVQCANALFRMVDEPHRIKRAFGHALDIAKVLPIEGERFLTFEYIGPIDYFDEGKGAPRVRGARCTSVDAAFRYRTSRGDVEVALVEWKYTESYLDGHPRTGSDETRRQRYEADFLHAEGPVRSDVVAFTAMLHEPFYQLMRQQMLAHRLEQEGVEGATAVRVLHVLSPANVGYEASLPLPEHRSVGSSVSEVWHTLLRRPDRFVTVDPAVFLHGEITSPEYVERYGHTDTA